VSGSEINVISSVETKLIARQVSPFPDDHSKLVPVSHLKIYRLPRSDKKSMSDSIREPDLLAIAIAIAIPIAISIAIVFSLVLK
jgi:hypothetical protein